MSSCSTARRTARVALAAVATGLAVTAAPASAHVTVTPTNSSAGSHTVATFSLSHGCDGSATTQIAISVPESITSVAPTRHPLYDVEKVIEELDEPITGSHGSRITERVAQVVYTAKDPLPDGQRDTFELSFQVPDAAGEVLSFPTVQTCEEGETAWIEQAPVGGAEPEHPAPAFTVAHATGVATVESDLHGQAGAESDEETRDPLTWVSVGLGAAGLLAGGAALARRRRNP